MEATWNDYMMLGIKRYLCTSIQLEYLRYFQRESQFNVWQFVSTDGSYFCIRVKY